METVTRPAPTVAGSLRARMSAWPVSRVTALAGVGLVAAAVLVVMNPILLLQANTPSGGDMGAHVYAPAYLRDHLLPSGRIMGWSHGWYAGFPIYYFYFPLTSLTIVALDLLLPYGVAFKLVTVAGLLALPPAAYLLARWMGFDRWVSTVVGAAGGSFVFMESFSIYGGNIPSTLAGEFSFSWSLALSLAYLGLVVRDSSEGRRPGPQAAVVLALTALTHLITTLAVVVASLPLLLTGRGRRAVVMTWGLGFALAAFWAVPLLARLGLTADMAWIPLSGWDEVLPVEVWAVGLLAVVGVVWTMRRGDPVVPLLWLTVLPVVAYFLLPQGKLWNGRFLPYWYLGLHLFAGLGVGLAASVLARWLPGGGWARPATTLAASLAFLGAALAGLSYIPGWVAWNYTGYEGKEAWPEYRDLMATIDGLPPGRVQWEANQELNQYGTPMAPMLFPYWTRERHPSMEGLYFESAITTPFHFLNAAEMSHRPSNPIPGLRYHTFDIDRGVAHLGVYGVRYYVSFTDEATDEARAHGALEEVASSPPFTIFELPEAPLVEVGDHLPGVYQGEDFHQASLRWYDDVDLLGSWMVASGPDHWPRVGEDLSGLGSVSVPQEGTVSDVVLEPHRVSFRTTAVGAPHLVKVSYFPNWQVEGARGPFRASPSLMVVVPTQEEVRLNFDRTWAESLGMALSGLGLLTAAALAASRRRAS